MSIGNKEKGAQELEVKLLKAIEAVEGRGRLVNAKHDGRSCWIISTFYMYEHIY